MFEMLTRALIAIYISLFMIFLPTSITLSAENKKLSKNGRKFERLTCLLKHHDGTGTATESTGGEISVNEQTSEWSIRLNLLHGSATIRSISPPTYPDFLEGFYEVSINSDFDHNSFSTVKIPKNRNEPLEINFFFSKANAELGAGLELMCF